MKGLRDLLLGCICAVMVYVVYLLSISVTTCPPTAPCTQTKVNKQLKKSQSPAINPPINNCSTHNHKPKQITSSFKLWLSGWHRIKKISLMPRSKTFNYGQPWSVTLTYCMYVSCPHTRHPKGTNNAY